jgi:hypothetical protein
MAPASRAHLTDRRGPASAAAPARLSRSARPPTDRPAMKLDALGPYGRYVPRRVQVVHGGRANWSLHDVNDSHARPLTRKGPLREAASRDKMMPVALSSSQTLTLAVVLLVAGGLATVGFAFYAFERQRETREKLENAVVTLTDAVQASARPAARSRAPPPRINMRLWLERPTTSARSGTWPASSPASRPRWRLSS